MKQFIEVPKPFKFQEVPVSLIDAEHCQDSLTSHLKTIAELGVLQSVILKAEGDRYTVIAGRRRVLAAKKAGIETVPAIVFEESSDIQIAVVSLIENMHRKPNPAEEAFALSKIMNAYGWDVKQASKALHIPVSHIRARLKLLDLIPELFEKARSGELRTTIALKIAKLPPEKQNELLSEEKITTEVVGKKLKEVRLNNLTLNLDDLYVPDVTHEVLERITAELRSVITQCRNGYKNKLKQALSILEEVKQCQE